MQINYNPKVEKLLTPKEVAVLLRTNENTLAYWRHQGTGPRFAKLGRRCFYREVDCIAWLNAQFNDQVSA